MQNMRHIVSLFFCLFWVTQGHADDAGEKVLDGYRLGIGLRQMETADFLMADIPLIDARIPLAGNMLKFRYGGRLTWGLTKFFVEWSYAAGLHFYPFGDFLSLSAGGHLGSFLLDNISYTGTIDADIEFKSGSAFISVGAEFFYRRSFDLLDFVAFPSFSDGGWRGESINLNSRGIGITVGVRF